MVRPNQVIRSSETTLTFLMFGRSQNQVVRRVLMLNFPGTFVPKVLKGENLNKYIQDVTLATEGLVNRYQVTVDLSTINA